MSLSEKIKQEIEKLKTQLTDKETQIKTIQETINNLQNQLNKAMQEHLFLQGKISAYEELLKNSE